MIESISLMQYMDLIEETDIEETILLAERWPLAIGRHPDLGRIGLVHVGELAAIITPPPVNCVVGVGPAA